MNSSSHGARDADHARDLITDIDQWSRQGRRLSSPAWFPLLVVSVAVFAALPFALLLGGNAAGYWAVVAPLSAVVTGWYFATRRVQLPFVRGTIVLVTGVVMLLVVAAFLLWFAGDSADFLPWIVIACGFGIFALVWRSVPTAFFAASTAVAIVVVALGGWGNVGVIMTLVVGVGAVAAAMVELAQADPGRAHA
ncbi:hypothetical protein ACIBED_07110 [Rhodococcus coprophilus]|nr:hypothetical protein [Rhodococcus coprophilus]MBM7459953.1 putative membrane protein YccC [Rhodococcus coprophilus]